MEIIVSIRKLAENAEEITIERERNNKYLRLNDGDEWYLITQGGCLLAARNDLFEKLYKEYKKQNNRKRKIAMSVLKTSEIDTDLKLTGGYPDVTLIEVFGQELVDYVHDYYKRFV